MFHIPPPSLGFIPNRKRMHQHHESKKWVRLPADQRCLECFPIPRPFLETAFGKIPPEIRADIFKDVLTVGSISPLKDGISVPITRQDSSYRGSEPELSIGPVRPASCLALLQTCRQIYHESSLLFYTLNTLYFSDPQELLLFLRHIGPVRCDTLRSLHLKGAILTTGVDLEKRSIIHPDTIKAIKLLNKRGNLRKIYLEMRPVQALYYIRICTWIPGLGNREMKFESPTRWSMMPPSRMWEKMFWYHVFLYEETKKSFQQKPYFEYGQGREEYRLEVDIVSVAGKRIPSTDFRRSADNGTVDGSSLDRAMEVLSL